MCAGRFFFIHFHAFELDRKSKTTILLSMKEEMADILTGDK